MRTWRSISGWSANGYGSIRTSTHCGDDALRIIEAYPDQGFKAWHRLKKPYNPAGGRFELDNVNKMLARRQCNDLSDLPAAIDILERDLKSYEATFGMEFPN